MSGKQMRVEARERPMRIEDQDGNRWPVVGYLLRTEEGIEPVVRETESASLDELEAAVKRLRGQDQQQPEGEPEHNEKGGLTEFGLFKSSLRWAVAWIEKCSEVPVQDDERDDWLEFVAAKDLLKDAPSSTEERAAEIRKGERG